MQFHGFFKVFLDFFEVFGSCRAQLLNRLAEQEDGLSFLKFRLETLHLTQLHCGNMQKLSGINIHCSSNVKNHFPSPALTNVLYPLLLQFLFFLGMFFNWRFQNARTNRFRSQIRFGFHGMCIWHGTHSTASGEQ